MLWCVDTSAWIDAVQRYNPASPLFEPFWRFIEDQIEAGRIVSPGAVHDELKEKTLKNAPAFAEFVKRNKGRLFVGETQELPAAKSPCKIPDVANARGVRTIPLHEFVDGIQGLSAQASQGGTTDADSEPDA